MHTESLMQEGLIEALAATRSVDPLFASFRNLDICRNILTEECVELFSCFEKVSLSAGELIYEAGSPSDHCVRLIVGGDVSYSCPDADVSGLLSVGDVFGLSSFLDEGRAHAATLHAVRDVTLLCISREYFDLITLEAPRLGNQLLRLMFRLLSKKVLKQQSEYATN